MGKIHWSLHWQKTMVVELRVCDCEDPIRKESNFFLNVNFNIITISSEGAETLVTKMMNFKR